MRIACDLRPAVIYRLRDEAGQLLYIGCSVDTGRRMQRLATDAGWWTQVARIDVEHFKEWPDALDAEREAIASERPVHNVQHNRAKNAA